MYKDDKRIWWDNAKYRIREYAKDLSKMVKRARNFKEKEIRKELKDIWTEGRENAQKKERKFRGEMLRSKAKYVVEGEKCTKFFFHL